MKKNILTITLLATVVFTGVLLAETANPKKAERMKNITRLSNYGEDEASISQRRGGARANRQGRFDDRSSGRQDRFDDRSSGRQDRFDDRSSGRQDRFDDRSGRRQGRRN